MDFTQTEQDDGVRFVWNNLPTTRLEILQNIIPLSMLYSPFFQREEPIQKMQGNTLLCSNCKWSASAFCPIDYTTMKFDCINCNQRNSLPSYYQNMINDGYTVPQFEATNTTMEYITGQTQEDKRPYIIFLIDTAVSQVEFEHIKTSLLKNIEKLEDIYVSLISFGKHVQLHDLQCSYLRETIVNGEHEYKIEELMKVLGLKESVPNSIQKNKFVQNVSDCKEKLLKIIRRLRPSTHQVHKNKRALRCTGQAYMCSVVVGASFGGIGGRIFANIGGPCTFGPGMIISDDLKEVYRNHEDLENNSDSIVRFEKSQKFYNSMIQYCNKHGITFDLFAFCLTQFGLGEMRFLIEKTGGMVVNQEEFIEEVYEQSFDKYIEQVTDDNAVYGAKMKVKCSKELYVSGFLGPAQLESKSKNMPKDAEGLIGESGGDTFIINSPLSTTTYLIFLQLSQADLKVSQKPVFFQITTQYYNCKGESIIRVANFMRQFYKDKSAALQGFDQEAGISTIARLAAHKGETIEVADLVYWINSVLIKFVRKFAKFQPNKTESFWIPNEISLLPQFMFYFRKSYFVQKFGTSIDEYALFKMSLMRENLSNMLVMIQPALFAYDLETQQPAPVLCDLDSLKPDIVILVDTYFYVLIWHGLNIHNWVQEGYHEQPGYEHIKSIIEQPKDDANLIVEDRLPVPKVIICHQGSPNERILKSKLNPSTTSAKFGDTNENYITDDVNMKKFMDYLIKLVVKQS